MSSQTIKERKALQRMVRSEEVLRMAEEARRGMACHEPKTFRRVAWGRLVLIFAAVAAVVGALLWA